MRKRRADQAETDLAPSSISSIPYRVLFQTDSEDDYCS